MLDEDVTTLIAATDTLQPDGVIGYNEAHFHHAKLVEFHSHDRHTEPVTHWRKWELR